MKVLITGATGFIGRKVTQNLMAQNHEVLALVRSLEKARATLPQRVGLIRWDGLSALPQDPRLSKTQAVLHLMGEGIAEGRWSAKRKQLLRDSRLIATQNLLEGLKRENVRLQVFSAASALGIYGDHLSDLDEWVDENQMAGTDFLAQLCRDWEKEVSRAQDISIRVCRLRLGLVLGREGGFLKKVRPIFKLGLGGPVGSGRQWVSWISLHDVVRLFVESLQNENMQGAINAVSPEPVRNRELMKTLARQLRRPSLLPVPSLALRLLYGEMAESLTSGVRLSNKRLEQTGFHFQYPRLKEAMTAALA